MAIEGVVGGERARPIAIGAAVVPLLAMMIFIQYVDRGNIATAAPLMKKELGLSASQMRQYLRAIILGRTLMWAGSERVRALLICCTTGWQMRSPGWR